MEPTPEHSTTECGASTYRGLWSGQFPLSRCAGPASCPWTATPAGLLSTSGHQPEAGDPALWATNREGLPLRFLKEKQIKYTDFVIKSPQYLTNCMGHIQPINLEERLEHYKKFPENTTRP